MCIIFRKYHEFQKTNVDLENIPGFLKIEEFKKLQIFLNVNKRVKERKNKGNNNKGKICSGKAVEHSQNQWGQNIGMCRPI